MPRAERQVPAVYFGRPGALISMPWPKGNLGREYERQTFDFLTGSGNHSVSSLSSGSRTFSLNWDTLHADTFARIEQFRTGMNGPGPWAFIDPSAPNLLPANVAAATGLYNNVTGFVSSGGTAGTVSSNSAVAFINRFAGSRSIRWRFLVAPDSFPVLGITPMYRSWWAQPVAPNLPYTFSSWIRADGIVDTSITMAMKMAYLDSAGTLIGSELSSGDVPISAWQRLSVSGTSPANAAYARPIWVATGSSIITGGSVYIDQPMLEQDSVLNDWAPGTGIRPVEIVSLPEVAPFAARFRTGTSMTLRELAR